jgi:hypothetical protein
VLLAADAGGFATLSSEQPMDRVAGAFVPGGRVPVFRAHMQHGFKVAVSSSLAGLRRQRSRLALLPPLAAPSRPLAGVCASRDRGQPRTASAEGEVTGTGSFQARLTICFRSSSGIGVESKCGSRAARGSPLSFVTRPSSTLSLIHLSPQLLTLTGHFCGGD